MSKIKDALLKNDNTTFDFFLGLHDKAESLVIPGSNSGHSVKLCFSVQN